MDSDTALTSNFSTSSIPPVQEAQYFELTYKACTQQEINICSIFKTLKDAHKLSITDTPLPN
jgi:hypothetical protein